MSFKRYSLKGWKYALNIVGNFHILNHLICIRWTSDRSGLFLSRHSCLNWFLKDGISRNSHSVGHFLFSYTSSLTLIVKNDCWIIHWREKQKSATGQCTSVLYTTIWRKKTLFALFFVYIHEKCWRMLWQSVGIERPSWCTTIKWKCIQYLSLQAALCA